MDLIDLYFFVKGIHGPLAMLTFFLVILSDIYGFFWIIGVLKHLDKKVLEFLHRIIFLGLLGLVLTGGSMLALDTSYFTNIAFLAKMFFVAVLLWNSFRIGKEINALSSKMFIELSLEEKKHMFIVGATSLVSWVSVFILVGLL